jgi:hypothetical protein
MDTEPPPDDDISPFLRSMISCFDDYRSKNSLRLPMLGRTLISLDPNKILVFPETAMTLRSLSHEDYRRMTDHAGRDVEIITNGDGFYKTYVSSRSDFGKATCEFGKMPFDEPTQKRILRVLQEGTLEGMQLPVILARRGLTEDAKRLGLYDLASQ